RAALRPVRSRSAHTATASVRPRSRFWWAGEKSKIRNSKHEIRKKTSRSCRARSEEKPPRINTENTDPNRTEIGGSFLWVFIRVLCVHPWLLFNPGSDEQKTKD